MDNIFRSFFGFPRRHSDESQPSLNKEIQPANEEDDLPSMFGRFSFKSTGDIFKQMEDLYSEMFNDSMSDFFNSLEDSIISLEGNENQFIEKGSVNGPEDGSSLRDKMLKQDSDACNDKTDSQPSWLDLYKHEAENSRSSGRSFGDFFGRGLSSAEKRDTDLDEVVKAEGLDSLFERRQRPKSSWGLNKGTIPDSSMPSSGFTSTFSSTSIYRGPDGSYRRTEKRMRPDGTVEESVSVRTQEGDGYTKKTLRDKQGNLVSEDSQDDKVDSIQRKVDLQANTELGSGEKAFDLSDRDGSRSIFNNLFGFLFSSGVKEGKKDD